MTATRLVVRPRPFLVDQVQTCHPGPPHLHLIHSVGWIRCIRDGVDLRVCT